MKRAYILIAIVVIVVFGIIAIVKYEKNKGSLDDNENIDTSDLESDSQDLNSLGNSVDSLDENVELNFSGSTAGG